MRSNALLLSFVLVTASVFAQTAPQTPPPAQPPKTAAPPPATTAKPTPPPAPRPATPAARAGMAITVTDTKGVMLSDIRVDVLGASDRTGQTNVSGQVNFPGLTAGTYRVRFSGEEVITYEREITVRAGQVSSVDVTLNPAPPKPEPAPPPPPAAAPAPVVGPPGKPQTLPIVELVEHDLIRNSEPRRDTLVACSGNTRITLIQLNEDQPDRLYDSAEVTYYVIAGEGAVRLGGRDSALAPSSFVSLPRGTAHSLIRRGRRPLIILATLSGIPCEQAR
jgi:carboxypeptidase family protein